jgi:hypothetical protein
MSSESFPYDVFLSHSAKDKAVVRPLGERLWQAGLNFAGICGVESGVESIAPLAQER